MLFNFKETAKSTIKYLVSLHRLVRRGFDVFTNGSKNYATNRVKIFWYLKRKSTTKQTPSHVFLKDFKKSFRQTSVFEKSLKTTASKFTRRFLLSVSSSILENSISQSQKQAFRMSCLQCVLNVSLN